MKKYHKVKIEIKPGDYVRDRVGAEFSLFGILGMDIPNEFNNSFSLHLESKSLPIFLIGDELNLILLDPKDGFQRITDLGMISQEEALTHNNSDIREYGLKLAGKL